MRYSANSIKNQVNTRQRDSRHSWNDMQYNLGTISPLSIQQTLSNTVSQKQSKCLEISVKHFLSIERLILNSTF